LLPKGGPLAPQTHGGGARINGKRGASPIEKGTWRALEKQNEGNGRKLGLWEKGKREIGAEERLVKETKVEEPAGTEVLTWARGTRKGTGAPPKLPPKMAPARLGRKMALT